MGLVLLLGLVMLMGCGRPEEIRIGFAGCLTGRAADLGISGRDAVILAVEEINAAGGINGRHVNLLIRDDRQDPGVAADVVQELVNEGVVAIIGHMTSAATMAGAQVADANEILMISPTSTTNDLTGLDDFLFRVTSPNAEMARQMAEHMISSMGIRSAAVIYDLGNRAYTESLFVHLRDSFVERGGELSHVETFVSGPQTHFMPLAQSALESSPEALVILASAMDTAMICQQLRKIDADLPVLSGEWASTNEILSFGGSAVDGITLFTTFDRLCTLPAYLEFKANYEARFGREPDFASTHAYDAAQVLFTVLERNDDPTQLRSTALEIGTFVGLQSDLSFDRFGDSHTAIHLSAVRDGEFQRRD